MASQQLVFEQTIRAMKLAMKRRADDSDSDEIIDKHTNRGNKLKRHAKYVQQDRLDDTGGNSYKKKVNHAGYWRTTISTNPPLYDEDGDPYSPVSSDDEAERYAEPLEDNPFGEVQLEHLLRPLTAVTELPEHPSLSIAFKSKALTQMAAEALEMLRRERASLWKAKRLLQRFRGDADWVPCSRFETLHDELLLSADSNADDQSTVRSIAMDHIPLELQPPRTSLDEAADTMDSDPIKSALSYETTQASNGEEMEGVETLDMAKNAVTMGDTSERGPTAQSRAEQYNSTGAVNGAQHETNINGDDLAERPKMEPDGDTILDHVPNQALADLVEREAVSETASNSNGTNTHAMTTRARARSPAERSDRTSSPSPSESASIPPIDPWFVPPSSSLTDRDLGLPPNEAEETRKLLLMYVQKQEQIVRSLDTLHAGLQKADRLRNFVYRSCKADGHLVADSKGNMVTEMSDGEDWYDISDWNLQPWELKDGQLEKGKDEVEDAEEEGRRRPGRGRRVNRI